MIMAKEASLTSSVSEVVNINSMLSEYDAYIYALAYRSIPHQLAHNADDLYDLEVDELVQRSRIKFWHALERRQVTFPKAYIRNIVYSECVDLARQHKSLLPLTVDDDGELYQGNILITPGEATSDPESIIEQKEQHIDRLKELISIVLKHLTGQQKLAFLCGLKEKVDDVDALNATLAEHQFKLEADICTPLDKAERRSWQASCSQARRTIAHYMQPSLGRS